MSNISVPTRSPRVLPRLLLTTTAAAICGTGCRPTTNSGVQDAAVYTGSLYMSLSPTSPAAVDTFNVVFAAKEATAALGYCAGSTISCAPSSSNYTVGTPIYDNGKTKFFSVPTALTLTDGMQLTIVGLDASGNQLEARTVQFARASGAAPTPSANGSTSPQTITNNQVWKDTSGNEIRAQGGTVIKVADTYYLYGYSMQNSVNCYSSKDLASWKYENAVYKSNNWTGRPDVAFNSTTNKYVMIVEWPNGANRNVPAYLTADTPCGNYTWGRVETDVFGYSMGDHSIFKDTDGRAYLVYTFDQGGQNASMGVAELNADYMSLKTSTATFTNGGGSCEAGNIAKVGGTYYLFSSDCKWWNSSPTMYRTSTDLVNWSGVKPLNTSTSTSDSFNTQVDFIITVQGTQTTSYIYAGDRYSEYTKDGVGLNAWYPLTFDPNNGPTLQGLSKWTIDVGTGVWAAAN